MNIPALISSVMQPRRSEAHGAPLTIPAYVPDAIWCLTPIGRGTRYRYAAELAQRALRALDFYKGGIDGSYGPMTERAVLEWNRSRGEPHLRGVLVPRHFHAMCAGVVNVRTITKLPRGILGESYLNMPPDETLTNAEKSRVFGRPVIAHQRPDGWVDLNSAQSAKNGLVLVDEVEIYLETTPGYHSRGTVTCNAKIKEQLQDLWWTARHVGLVHSLVNFGGMFAPRLVRGGNSLSSHTWGIAFDINTQQNGLGRKPAGPDVVGEVSNWIPLARAFGFEWGGRWQRPDGMHFEAFEVHSQEESDKRMKAVETALMSA